MMRSLKALGLALVAIFAIGAIAAQAALANQFHSGATETTVTVASNAQQVFQYETAGEKIVCSSVGGSGEATQATVSEITFTPTYSGCEAQELGNQAHVEMNGCDYTFTIEAGSNTGPAHVKCPTGKQIRITVTFFGSSLCTLKVGEQTPKGTTDYSNPTGSQVRVQPTQKEISGSREGSSLCGKASSTQGTYTGTVDVKGEVKGQQTATNVQVG